MDFFCLLPLFSSPFSFLFLLLLLLPYFPSSSSIAKLIFSLSLSASFLFRSQISTNGQLPYTNDRVLINSTITNFVFSLRQSFSNSPWLSFTPWPFTTLQLMKERSLFLASKLSTETLWFRFPIYLLSFCFCFDARVLVWGVLLFAFGLFGV